MNKAVILNVLFSLMLLACKESDSHKLKRLERYVPKDEVVYIADAPIVLGLSKLNYNSMPVDDLPQSLDPNKKPEIDDEVYELVRVKDGDTIVVMGSDGEITVRLLGIDTPEMRDSRPIVKYFAERAMLFVTNKLNGERILLGLDPINDKKNHKDHYGRVLGYVYTADDSTLVNSEIVKQGYGFSFVKYPCMYTDYFSALERGAREQKRGLWGKIR